MPFATLPSRLDISAAAIGGQVPDLQAEEGHGSGTPADDSSGPSLSLASILGDSLSEDFAGLPSGEEEPISLMDVGSGTQLAVESIGVSEEEVMALIDRA